MRHRVHNKKLGRSGSHREALIASLVSSLAKHRVIRTTLVKAKEARRAAEKLVTLAKKGTVASRRLIRAARTQCGERRGGKDDFLRLIHTIANDIETSLPVAVAAATRNDVDAAISFRLGVVARSYTKPGISGAGKSSNDIYPA